MNREPASVWHLCRFIFARCVFLFLSLAAWAVAPPLTLSGGGLSVIFPDTHVNSSATQTVQFTVTGPITVTAVSASGAFSVADSSGCALPLSQASICTLRMRFTPTVPGRAWSPLVITDLNGTKYSFGLAGYGIAPMIGFPQAAVTFFAGNATYGYSGDGGPALSASLATPFSIARDSGGNFYIADADNNVIRKIDTNGIINTVVGDGNCGYSGDGGPAASAEICWPSAVTIDAADNLYIGDSENYVVRRVDVNGIISTIAGNGTNGFSGDGGPAISASMSYTSSLSVDEAGNLYIGDGANARVRKVDTSGIITTILLVDLPNGLDLDNGSLGPISPEGIAVDHQGNVYVSDADENVVLKVDSNGNVSIFAGTVVAGYSGDGGAATLAQLNFPARLVFDSAGELIMVDANNCVIRKVDSLGVIMTIAGTFCPPQPAQVNRQVKAHRAQSLPSRATKQQARPVKLSAAAAATVPWPTLPQGNFNPQGLTIDPNGNLYVSDFVNNVVVKVDFANPVGVDFGSVMVGHTSSPKPVLVANRGNANLQFEQISIASEFLLSPQGGDCTTAAPLSAGSGCPIHISFSPTQTGNQQGTLALTSNAINGPQAVPLAGVGLPIPPDFTLTTPTKPVATNNAGSASATVTAWPSGGFSGTITLACTGLPADSTCAFTPASLKALGDNSRLDSALVITRKVISSNHAAPTSPTILYAALSAVGLVGTLFVPAGRRSVRRQRWMVLLILAIASLACFVGCGSSSGAGNAISPLSPPTTYTFTVTATSGSLSRTGVVTVIVP